MKTEICATALIAALASAAPLEKRQATADIDNVILNYALTLEHLEAAFYREGLAKYSAADFANAGFAEPDFYGALRKVGADEAAHVSVIQQTQASLGFASVQPCTYNFRITSPRNFLATASILEGVGTNAYLGAAASVTNSAILTAAGSILVSEARHNAFIRNERGQSPFPQAFEIPLNFNQVFSLAAPYIVSCPASNPALPVKAFPRMRARQTAPGRVNFRVGEEITFMLPKRLTFNEPVYVAWPSAGGVKYTPASPALDGSQDFVVSRVPDSDVFGPRGQVYAILTSSPDSLTDANTIAGPAIVNVV